MRIVIRIVAVLLIFFGGIWLNDGVILHLMTGQNQLAVYAGIAVLAVVG
jgi:hypothetical protein